MADSFTQSYTCAAASLTGHASNATGAAWTIATGAAGDGLAHKVTVRNDSVTDHGAKTIVLVGVGPNGETLTETIAAPGTSATVTSTLYYKSLTSATPSATIGADTFDIGWTAAAHSPWLKVAKCPATVVCFIGGTINFDIQHSHSSSVADSNLYPFNAEAGKTASTEHIYTSPVQKVRINVNSHTSGTFALQVAS